jgi:hypothetical protein
MAEQLKIASLPEPATAKIAELEQMTGRHIMAFERGLAFADLSPEQVRQIGALEDELDVILLVYDN